jgi:hypothetical protein
MELCATGIRSVGDPAHDRSQRANTRTPTERETQCQLSLVAIHW